MQVTLAFLEGDDAAATIGVAADVPDIVLTTCYRLSDGYDFLTVPVVVTLSILKNLGRGYYSIDIGGVGSAPVFCAFEYALTGSLCDITANDVVVLADGAHGGPNASFETAAGVLAQESTAGAVETAAGVASDSAQAAQTAALRTYTQSFLSVERWTGLAATIDSGTLAVGQRITLYHAPAGAPDSDQIIAHIEPDGTVTFDGEWTPPAELEQISVLKVENDAQGSEVADPIVVTLTITSDEEPMNGATITITIPGTNAAGDDRCWYVKADGTLVRCGGGTIMPDTRLAEAASGGGTAAAPPAGSISTVPD